MAKECTISSIPFLGNEGVAYYVITRNPDGGMCGETVNVTVNTVCTQFSLHAECTILTCLQSTSSVILRSSIRRNLNLPCTQTVQVFTVSLSL